MQELSDLTRVTQIYTQGLLTPDLEPRDCTPEKEEGRKGRRALKHGSHILAS